MQTSATITKISAALVLAQSEMSNAVKDAINPFFKKSYADLNAVREAILPALNKHKISAIQPTCIIEGVDYVETVLLHESGEYISSLTRIVVDKVNDAQRHGSGLSYARRYALQSIVNIGAEDDDANKAVGNKPEGPEKVKIVTKETVDEIVAKDKALKDAIAGLESCSTENELKMYKKTLAQGVIKHPDFVKAGKSRYEKIMPTVVQ